MLFYFLLSYIFYFCFLTFQCVLPIVKFVFDLKINYGSGNIKIFQNVKIKLAENITKCILFNGYIKRLCSKECNKIIIIIITKLRKVL